MPEHDPVLPDVGSDDPVRVRKSHTPLNLYFVECVFGDTSDNQDLFVKARHTDRAIDHWRTYYEIEGEKLPDRIRVVSRDVKGEDGPVPWDDMEIVFQNGGTA